MTKVEKDIHKKTEEDFYEARSRNLDDELMATVGIPIGKTVRVICGNVSRYGLSIEEACILSKITIEDFNTLRAKYKIVEDVVVFSALSYKKMLLAPIIEKAKIDDKTAQWLLERRYPNEYGNKKVAKKENDNLADALDFIQDANQNISPITSSGKSKKNKDVNIIEKLDKYLS